MGGSSSRIDDSPKVEILKEESASSMDSASTDIVIQSTSTTGEDKISTMRREMLEARESELRQIEASQIEEVQRQVHELEAAYDFVRPPPVPRCVDEEHAVVQCYQKQLENGQDVLKCAHLVSIYSECAQKVAAELAAAVSEASKE
mmetsp:Transcript_21094/g.27338  ORF Transcript_21094/g.27338 Transcript_21094/m.27338 type:complete len:146 (+) Transcript_21094:49-486(+)|eukprot:CAMPEP_0197291926 /NCGR_PEP_ID=MMETSP0890-20130614/20170_1 /TAXON_ID=44058 ORGANISM="Aureoumbra lagunensis, Strain CCMP1510" /NCGR_SAMPLE_ID=MMETSP0890 /ASSEMBLY_ACC=CAM_ASM_000533 /LENGTH=145 /DNA_ID=CAMNT_0042765419 /DNA_START=46 /DNA_END=483 /DNA_ORIENTATION=+